MKILSAIFLLVVSLQAMADEVRVEVNPTKPVSGEVFQAYFRVFTESDDEPTINFSPTNLEVVDKSNQGVSTRTVYANGRLTVTREVTIVYNLVSSRTGQAWIRDIQVQVGGKTIRHPSVTINVLKEPEVAADVFVMADVPKKTLFLGEGITVRYYLYSKVPVQNLDVKKYPKLNNFLKRFIQEPERTERVSADGQVYLRSQIYAAKLFPEKAGQLKIDSMSLSATYPTTRAGDPFGAFGLSRELKTRTLNSETVTIQVNPLPEPVPPHFTGLVGKHDFDLEFGQSRLIVNEPLTVKLTVTGSGALENFEAPDLVKHPGLEEFESNGDLKIADATEATKIFDYTFLPKENLKIPESQITLSYLDADTGKYIPKTMSIPEIVIAGGSTTPKAEKDTPKEQDKKDVPKEIEEKVRTLSGPILKETPTLGTLFPYINGFLAFVSVLIALSWIVKFKGLPALGGKHHIPAGFRKGQFEFGEFARWLSPLINKTGKSPASLIRESDLDTDTKNYFLQLLEQTGKGQYSSSKATDSYEYDHRHFKKLSRYIASASHETTEQPS
ncbi:MAG: BatD family protein [Bdellovibrionota bacterium]